MSHSTHSQSVSLVHFVFLTPFAFCHAATTSFDGSLKRVDRTCTVVASSKAFLSFSPSALANAGSHFATIIGCLLSLARSAGDLPL